MNVLNIHPDVRCLKEPFHPKGNPTLPANAGELRHALENIRKRHNAIKHVWHPSGWPFASGSTLNEDLLLEPGCQVILLSRRNSLQRVVSEALSFQTGIWHVSSPADQVAVRLNRYAPLDIPKLRAILEAGAAAERQQVSKLINTGRKFMQLFYEDLYGNLVPLPGRILEVNRILDFIGRGALTTDAQIESAYRLLDTASNRLNACDVYHLLPNANEVNSELGSDERGWLFDSSSPGG